MNGGWPMTDPATYAVNLEIRERVLSRARERGISGRALALSCGLEQSYFSARRSWHMSTRVLYRVADILDCEPADLLVSLDTFRCIREDRSG